MCCIRSFVLSRTICINGPSENKNTPHSHEFLVNKWNKKNNALDRLWWKKLRYNNIIHDIKSIRKALSTTSILFEKVVFHIILLCIIMRLFIAMSQSMVQSLIGGNSTTFHTIYGILNIFKAMLEA